MVDSSTPVSWHTLQTWGTCCVSALETGDSCNDSVLSSTIIFSGRVKDSSSSPEAHHARRVSNRSSRYHAETMPITMQRNCCRLSSPTQSSTTHKTMQQYRKVQSNISVLESPICLHTTQGTRTTSERVQGSERACTSDSFWLPKFCGVVVELNTRVQHSWHWTSHEPEKKTMPTVTAAQRGETLRVTSTQSITGKTLSNIINTHRCGEDRRHDNGDEAKRVMNISLCATPFGVRPHDRRAGNRRRHLRGSDGQSFFWRKHIVSEREVAPAENRCRSTSSLFKVHLLHTISHTNFK